MFLSKLPIDTFLTLKYQNCASTDCFSNKGAFLAQFKFCTDSFKIIGTHLQSENNYQEFHIQNKVREMQLIELLNFSSQTSASYGIYAGDFNVSKADTNHYNFMINTLEVVDYGNFDYSFKDFWGKLNKKYLYDYFLISKQTSYKYECKAQIDNKTIFENKVSNYYPLIYTIKKRKQ